MKEFAIID